MNADDMKLRTKKFALRILKLADSLPRSITGRTPARQMARSGTSVAANYRAAGKARSKAEFIAKLGIAEEEADETRFWLELIIESGLIRDVLILPLLQDSHELTAIIAASRKSASQKNKLAIEN
jgi:four helix bundle protein